MRREGSKYLDMRSTENAQPASIGHGGYKGGAADVRSQGRLHNTRLQPQHPAPRPLPLLPMELR